MKCNLDPNVSSFIEEINSFTTLELKQFLEFTPGNRVTGNRVNVETSATVKVEYAKGGNKLSDQFPIPIDAPINNKEHLKTIDGIPLEECDPVDLTDVFLVDDTTTGGRGIYSVNSGSWKREGGEQNDDR